jgi:hypothetical protein
MSDIDINTMSEKEALRAISDKKWKTMIKVKDGKGFEPKEVKLTVEPNSSKPLDINELSQISESEQLKAKNGWAVTLYNELEPVDNVYEVKKAKIIERAENLKAVAKEERESVRKLRRVRRYDISGAEIRVTQGTITIDNFEYAELLHASAQLLEIRNRRNALKKSIEDCQDLLNAMTNMMVGFNVDLDYLEKSP